MAILLNIVLTKLVTTAHRRKETRRVRVEREAVGDKRYGGGGGWGGCSNSLRVIMGWYRPLWRGKKPL